MIYCPKCGTANRRGSRFCNDCGEMLPMYTALRCPMCGTMNPIANAYCDQCNARIVPMTTPSGEGAEGESPPIRGLSLPAIPPEERPPSEPLQAASVDEAKDWLAQLRELRPEEGEAEGLPTPATETEAEEKEPEDWLAQLRDSAAEVAEFEPQAAAEPVEPAEIPDWLRDLGPVGLRTATPEAPPPAAELGPEEITPAMPTPTPAEAPDWLQELAPSEKAAPEAPLPAAELGPEEITPAMPTPTPAEGPDWLQELAPPEKAAPEAPLPTAELELEETTPVMPTPVPAEVPDWLQELAPPEKAAPEVPLPAVELRPEEITPAMPTPAPAEVPDWLQELAPPEKAAPEVPLPAVELGPEETTPVMPAPAPAEVPDWLQELAPPGKAAPEAAPLAAELEPEETAPAMPAPAPAEVPDWLQELAPPEEATTAAVPPSPPPFVGAPLPVAEGAPEWLAELEQEGPPPATSAVPALEEVTPPFAVEAKAAEAAGLARAEIPAWLEAMRPREEAVEKIVEEEPVETKGLLEGLRGTLAPLPIPEEILARARAIPTASDEATLARAQLLQSLLTRPPETPQPEARGRYAGIAEKAPRWLVAAILFTVVVGMLAPKDLVGYTAPTVTQPLGTTGRDVYDAVEGVTAGDVILVAFEYGPAEADELNAVARPILTHLVKRGANISAASTQAEGIGVAEMLRSDIGFQQQITVTYKSPPQYLPGGATGIAELLTSIDPKPKLILVLAARPTPLRWWIEQTSVHSQSTPVVAGLSAVLEPIASPYLDDNATQLEGATIGLREAADYETHLGAAGSATQRLNVVAVGQMTVAALILAGAIVYSLSGPHGRMK